MRRSCRKVLKRGSPQSGGTISIASSTAAPISRWRPAASGACRNRSMRRRCTRRRSGWSASTTSRPFATANARQNRRRKPSIGSMSAATARTSRLSLRRARSCTAKCARWSVPWSGSARDVGARTISPPRSRPATAPLAGRSRRPTDFIWCGWIIKLRSREITLEYPAINPGQPFQIRQRHAFIDLMHGLADQPEFDHRTIMRDEACVGRAAAGVEIGLSPRDLLDRRHHQLGESSGLGDEHAGIGRLPHDAGANPVAGSLRHPRLDQTLQGLVAVTVVEADVEFRARLRRDHIGRGIADIDRGEFEVGGLKVRAAVVKLLLAQRYDKRRDIRHRIRRAMRISHMALHAVDDQRARQRAAPPDLDAVAELLDIAGLAQHAMIEFLAARRGPLQKFYGTVDRDVFLIARDQKRDRAFRRAAIRGQVVERCCDAAGDPALHVDRAAAMEHAVLYLAGERAMRPCTLVARRYHVGMAGEGEMRRATADPGIEIFDVCRAGLAERDAVHLEAGALEHIFEDIERAGISGRYGPAAQQIAREGERVRHQRGGAG